ncbi:gliding motility lipoprotein GldH [Mucilaginibacter roseus]|uniref:Gliding motility lipoprotein GldH n=1 Tax=Mucilaginibacter roseus TaxID=1528868 RepID=A0ABS8U5T4_9SPHI|nr:gliding motility lipoprotein GldH [Mucilaginibacter roseus]MCD8741485.1 gliding motility lipoprotein GldH [Mucilaginibacter roseus]
MKKLKYLLTLTAITALFSSCANPNTVLDENKAIPNHNWAYTDPLKYDVKIDDAALLYNIYLNLRVTGDYKYSNIFIIFRRAGHGKKAQATRYEFKLAKPDGEWLGAGSGNLYSYRFVLLKGHKFPEKGVYHVEIEQNMRDNPLREISDAGLCVEKAK